MKYRIFQCTHNSSKFANPNDDPAAEYFKEVLISYRLIFGQTRSSYRDFNSLVSKKSLIWFGTGIVDPLLPVICGHSWDSEQVRSIYDEIDVDEASDYYTTSSDFPYLGERLEILQEYVRDHRSTTMTALWNDRRDVGWWWTFWVSSMGQ